ncbi:enoyl-CoA hydratase [Ponticoccus sp. SC2-23]|uniref:enoyl-CoA hydratase n=1 Tax=Alexandriicola marinus TaxID=2081710 RepID=UPI000FDC0B4C|nr:enoyl-CoA hydratase [Alexandriicola marinus]MBM1218787.1 enoyl-CoA hydratase [Ponticoccus sp. SC6-9]MBM1224141.1 enoyl-CoA hydratase [Ponticoccus sp. SC6-15]MBM1230080.1 enoyl-CoA hydratase [Ponticoccus sp. SC6-38]MBM1233107.1 enoyl-CoA hydratase [Ponticoccus sp. SC6-45]MBM1236943.1 enoyl-CoA hydratase [Ponticoccus sp. SC6-49]MBM1242118.1 enoyl-CoA hydratase [Ponticoccus sp. SC2-64]MBM1246631.1 enoyl-CoA hydratase [Ponticoccus sp. SC6-42]MBM1251109.1 enoyl-CoA hydratase [Ponticoccus sp. 
MPLVLRDDKNAIATLTLNAPEKLNALSDAMLAELSAQIEALSTDKAIRVVVLAASGKAFCAGHDLKEMQAGRQSEDGGAAYFADLFSRCSDVMLGLQRLPQPVIARVHGVAAAAGCQLVASCDMAVASTAARFGVNGVNIGLFCSTPMVAMTRAIAPRKAFEMLVTGRFADAGEAEAMGLVNRAVAPDDLDAATDDLARTVASKLDRAVAIGKRAFYDQAALETEAAYALTGQVMVENLLDNQTEAGIAAFLDKRPPPWAE